MDRKGLKVGDLVTRTATCVDKDYFLCHEFSFGQIVEFRTETIETRPDCKVAVPGEPWVEAVVFPFDVDMAPIKGKPWIQWVPGEIVKISKVRFILMIILWPMLKRIYSKPLDGRVTDRGVSNER